MKTSDEQLKVLGQDPFLCRYTIPRNINSGSQGRTESQRKLLVWEFGEGDGHEKSTETYLGACLLAPLCNSTLLRQDRPLSCHSQDTGENYRTRKKETSSLCRSTPQVQTIRDGLPLVGTEDVIQRPHSKGPAHHVTHRLIMPTSHHHAGGQQVTSQAFTDERGTTLELRADQTFRKSFWEVPRVRQSHLRNLKPVGHMQNSIRMLTLTSLTHQTHTKWEACLLQPSLLKTRVKEEK